MEGSLRLLAMFGLFAAVWPSQAFAQEEQESIISIYRIAPGQQAGFIQWMAEREAAALEAGVPASQWYVHTNGDSWDFLSIALDLTDAQGEAVDAAETAMGLTTGAAASIELRRYIASHTDTFVAGPVTAAEIQSAIQGD